MNIIVSITPDSDGVHCSECRLFFRGAEPCPWRRYDEHQGYTRGPLCLAAEEKMRDLVEAGDDMKRQLSQIMLTERSRRDWDRAVAALKEEK